ncbi:MAG: metallophosphoesterase family protein [Deltaproteobacteria bacterium]|nr:metallophosphoesterase family protein [Deltaproteobacteria bacterium]
MRIGFFSDIHGNVLALEAVLADMKEEGVEAYVCAGDLAAFGPRPREVIQRLNDMEGLMIVRGNTERWLDLVRSKPLGPYDEKVLEKVRPALAWTIEKLSDDSITIMADLPLAGMMEGDGVALQVEHASPGSDWVGIQPEVEDERLGEMFDGFEGEAFVCGHTHKPLMRKVGEILVVNDGSVGFPYDGVPRPSWVLVEVSGGVKAEIRRVDYDRDAVRKDIADVGMVWGDVMSMRLETAVM